MGGQGSGRWYRPYRKATTDASMRLDVRYLRRQGLLHPGRISALVFAHGDRELGRVVILAASSGVLVRFVTRGGDARRGGYTALRFTHTSCGFGGTRLWWQCPRCAKRVSIVYLLGEGLACRTCGHLGYSSQYEDAATRALSRLQAARERVGAQPGLQHRLPPRPRYMHRTKYRRLWLRLSAAYEGYRAALADLIAKEDEKAGRSASTEG